MITIEPHAEGCVLPIRASPGARRNGVTGVHNGMLKVSVTQAPEKGKANKALAAVLAKALGLRKSQVELLSGETSQEKRFLIRDVDAARLRQKLEAELETG